MDVVDYRGFHEDVHWHPRCVGIFHHWLYFSKYGNIKLGKPDDKPVFNDLTFFKMLFAAGIGIGLFELGVVADSCEAIASKQSRRSSGSYKLEIKSSEFEVYCEIAGREGWTLIARFSNSDNTTWMRDDGYWWYDQQAANGTTTDPSNNADMISPAFWLLSGREIKITRSDDPSHTPLLQTTGNCLAGKTFRSKITSYGDFRNGKVWASNQCLGSCTVQYGGQYKSTDGFQQAECSGGIQSANKIGFWCDYGGGDGSVMMIGGGGSGCERADHGIGITEADAASFVEETAGTQTEYDFGYDARTENAPSQSYSLNLWIR